MTQLSPRSSQRTPSARRGVRARAGWWVPAAATLVLASSLLGGCARDETERVTASDLVFQGLENTALSGTVVATSSTGGPLTFSITTYPLHGTLQLERATGAFTYTPVLGFAGTDEFQFVAVGERTTSLAARVALAIVAVNDAPVAQPQSYRVLQNGQLNGRVVAIDPDVWSLEATGNASSLMYLLQAAPIAGTLDFDGSTGAFTYRPDPGFAGDDSFTFVASDGLAVSPPATVTIVVTAVTPQLPPLPDLVSSPDGLDTTVLLPTQDSQGTPLRYVVTTSDPEVVTTTIDAVTGTLTLSPVGPGQAVVTVTASNGQFATTKSFLFTAVGRTTIATFAPNNFHYDAITVRNTGTDDIRFQLRHNGRALMANANELLQEIRAYANPTDGFERTLWRFARDFVYHKFPLAPANWQSDPLLLVNAIGFGFCSEVATAYVAVAQLAGYESRVWSLTDHVVPEIFVGGRWMMYDPDLAVFYFRRDDSVAGILELEADPTLVSSPTSPVLDPVEYPWPYGDVVTQIYANAAQHHLVLGAPFYPRSAGALRLPAGASFTYPGRWAVDPTSANGEPVTIYAQLRVDLTAGFVGTVDWPLVPWDVQGAGTVRVHGREYVVGSPELAATLQGLREAPAPIEVLSSPGPVTIIYLVNPLRFSLDMQNEVQLSSVRPGRLTAELVPLPQANRLLYYWTTSVQRPKSGWLGG